MQTFLQPYLDFSNEFRFDVKKPFAPEPETEFAEEDLVYFSSKITMDSIDGWSNPPLENMDSHFLLPQVEDQAANGIILQSLPQDSVTFAISGEKYYS